MKTKHLIVLIATACASLTAARSIGAPREVVETSRTISSTPGQIREDLGDIRPLEARNWFSLINTRVEARGEFQSNAELRGNSGRGDFVWQPSISFDLDLPLNRQFSVSVGARIESYLYSRFSGLSFWGVSGAATLNYQPRRDWPTIYAGAVPYIYNDYSGSLISDAIGLTAGIQQNHVFNHGRTTLFGDYNFTRYYSDPAFNDRSAHRVTVGVTQQLRPALYGQIYYSFQYSDYRGDRDDARNVAGANLVYQFSEHLTGKLTANYIHNDSSESFGSYRNVAIGAGLTYKF